MLLQANLISDKTSEQLLLVEEALLTALYCSGLSNRELLKPLTNPVKIEVDTKYLVIDNGGNSYLHYN